VHAQDDGVVGERLSYTVSGGDEPSVRDEGSAAAVGALALEGSLPRPCTDGRVLASYDVGSTSGLAAEKACSEKE